MSRLASPIAAFVIILAASLVHASPRANAAESPLYTVSGVVLSDQGGPLEGAEVYGYSYSEKGDAASDKAVTDAEGHFSLKLGPGNATVNANYAKWSYANAFDSFYLTGNETGVKLVIASPPPKTAILQGRVLDADGNPLADAQVSLNQACCYAYGGYGKEAPPTPVTTTPTTAMPENSNASSSSSGSGSSASSGMAIARPIYYPGDSATVTTGKDGAFRFEAYGGPHQLTVFLKGYAQTNAQVDLKENATKEQDVKMLKVPKATVVLHGRVVDAVTGAPIENAGVSIQNLEWSRSAYATTGKDGAYTFTVLPGWSQISVYVNDCCNVPVSQGDGISDKMVVNNVNRYYQWLDTTKLDAGDKTLDIKLEPRPLPTIAIVGYAVDPDAKTGVEGATISISNQDTGDWGNAVTDKTGSFKLLVRPGHFTINAYAPGHLGGATTFTVVEGAATKRVDVDLPAGESRYAPCDDTADCCCSYPMPMMAGESRVATDGSYTPIATTPTATTMAVAKNDNTTSSQLANGQSAPANDGTRAAAYSGSGGGLPPYDASHAATANGAPTSSTPPAVVPSVGFVAALGTLATVAAVLSRRRK